MNVYPFIEAEKSKQCNVARACVLLKVSRSAFYAHRTAAPSQRERDDAELTDAILAVYEEPTAPTARRGCTPSWSTRAAATAANASPGSCAPPAAAVEHRNVGAPPPCPTRPPPSRRT